jgi:DNA-binding transcriptional regulator YiaG
VNWNCQLAPQVTHCGMNEFSKAKEILRDVERHSRQTKCDWDDPLDVAEYRRAERTEDRTALLDLLAPRRVCPECGTTRPLSRSWVLNKRKTAAMCRSCYQRRFEPNQVYVDTSIFESETRYRVDGAALEEMRTSLGMTISEFARRAGWSRQYQSQLESGSVTSVTHETASVVLTVIREAGGETEDASIHLRGEDL